MSGPEPHRSASIHRRSLRDAHALDVEPDALDRDLPALRVDAVADDSALRVYARGGRPLLDRHAALRDDVRTRLRGGDVAVPEAPPEPEAAPVVDAEPRGLLRGLVRELP